MRLIGPLLAVSLAGCAMTIDIPTSPDTFNVEPAALSHLRQSQGIAVKNGYGVETKREIKMHPHTWAFDLNQHTESAVVMLRRAMAKHGIGTAENAEKTITLRVRDPQATVRMLPGFAQTRAVLALDAEFGDGTKTYIEAENMSPWGAQRAYDGAILFALNRLLTDDKFVAYVNKQ